MHSMHRDNAARKAMVGYLQKIAIGPKGSRSLTRQQAYDAMNTCLNREVSDVQIGVFMVALRMKRETIEEYQGVLDALVHASSVMTAPLEHLIALSDPYGGFERAPHFSGAVAAVLATCGLPTYVHGARTMPPKNGLTARQILEAGGHSVASEGDAALSDAVQHLERHGVAYIDVEDFAPSLFALTDVRSEIVKRPCLSLLEKLITPIRGTDRTTVVSGWVHRDVEHFMLDLLRGLSIESALLLRGVEGHIDPHVSRNTEMSGYRHDGEPAETLLQPKSYGALLSSTPDWEGLDAAQVYALWQEALHPKTRTAPGQSTRLLAGTIMAHVGHASTIMRGVGEAHEAIVSGRAAETLKHFSP